MQLLERHFDAVFAAPDGIKKLRELILSLAVQGKLVPQDLNEPPARELLREIETERKRRHSKGRISTRRLEGSDMRKRFAPDCSLPQTWEWVCLNDLGYFLGGKTPNKNISKYWGGNIPWVSPKDMKILRITDSEDHVTDAGVQSGLSIVPEDSILMVVRSGILRRKFPVARNTVACTINQDLKALVPFLDCLSSYLLLMLRGFEKFILTRLTKMGVTVESIIFEDFSKALFPLPPLSEQRRIVAKVDHLMIRCDELEKLRAERAQKCERLLDALIYKMLNSTTSLTQDRTSVRAVLGCYIISKMAGKRFFGRTAEMKMLYLAEAHLALNLGGQYLRDVAGPFDKWIYQFEQDAEKRGWFKTAEKRITGHQIKIEYLKGSALDSKASEVESLLKPPARKELDRLLNLFSSQSTEEVELITTVFAAWNDFLIDDHTPTDDEIIREVRENWHSSKRRFTSDRLKQCLMQLRRNALVPKGVGPSTRRQRGLIPH